MESGLEETINQLQDVDVKQLILARIKELEEQVENYKRESRTDHLTGSLNLRGFQEVLERTISRNNRYEIGFSFGFVDLYDLRGHNKVDYSKGDEAIIKLSKILTENARMDDSVARTGGDEFSLIITGLKEDKHDHYIKRMNNIIANEQRIVQNIPFIAYWGLAEYKGQQIDELRYEATQKLNQDKKRIKEIVG